MLAFSNDYYGMIFRATQSVELFCAYEKHLKCGKKINLQDFSECEMGILDDLSSNYDL